MLISSSCKAGSLAPIYQIRNKQTTKQSCVISYLWIQTKSGLILDFHTWEPQHFASRLYGTCLQSYTTTEQKNQSDT